MSAAVGPESPRRLAFGTLSGFVAFGMGAGLVPVAPGTVGSAVAIPLAAVLLQLPPPLFWLAWVVALVSGVYCCGITSRRLGASDPGGIVWDEMVAMWLLLGCLPMAWPWWLAAFTLFRLFDILKPWPIRTLERLFAGGTGIMLDDIAAAGMALALLLAARWLLLIGMA